MTFSIFELQATFSNRALWTNTLINSAIQTGLGILEETITNVNLIEIGLSHKDFIVTKEFNRKEEGAASGADWLWFIGEPGCWFPLLVQAKIINPRTSKCFYMNYRNGEQRSLLYKFARINKFYPLYCIYSFISDEFSPYSHLSQSLININPKEWACSFVSPNQIKKLVRAKRRNQADVLRYGVPWAYPFQYAANHEEFRFGKAIAEAFLFIEKEFNDLDNGNLGLNKGEKEKKKAIQNRNLDNLLTNKIPNRFLKPFISEFVNYDLPVAGLGIISTTPIQEVLKQPKGKFS